MVQSISRVEELKTQGFNSTSLRDLKIRHVDRVHRGIYDYNCVLCKEYSTDLIALEFDEADSLPQVLLGEHNK